MRKILPVLLGLGGYLVYRFTALKKAVDNITIKLTFISFGKTGLSNTALHLTMSVYNPENTELSFQQFFGQIFYQGTSLANFMVSNPVVIAANGITSVPLDAGIQNLNMLSVLGDLMKTGTKDLVMRGTMVVSGIHLPVNINLADYG